jgi:precorrin-6B C5,15-methyltransferase / cobalt-precorrin-6B C5,C15-methyltransferase
VAVLVSGDPFWFGAGATLARLIPADEMLVIPVASSLSIAAARLGWALQDTTVLGLNMKGLVPLLKRHLHHGRRILALSLNGETPREVAALLTSAGFGPSRITVLEALGGPRERMTSAEANTFGQETFDPLNIVAIDVVAGPDARALPFSPGLPDDLFENDGQLTKREIRAMTIAALAPCAGELLWDVGLGSGSVAIEWLLAHSSMRAIGFEKNAERAARATRNAVAFGVPHLEQCLGPAPNVFNGLPAPDAIFVGGGVGNEGVIEACWQALKPGGRIVANGVTLETEAKLIGAHQHYGGTLTRLSIERADAVGSKTAWRPAMPIVQWVARK